jgi:hypothetical protein
MSPNPLLHRVNLRCSAPEVHIVGEIVIGFGNLELYLDLGIWQLLSGSDNRTQTLAEAITAEMSFDRKVHAFSSLYKLRGADGDAAELQALVKSLFDVQGERNAIVHSAWSYSESLEGFTRMKASAKARRGLQRRLHRMAPGRLEDVRVRIARVGERLARFVLEKIQGRTWPTKTSEVPGG